MFDWFEGLAGPEFATAVLWTFAALILLVIVLIIVKLVRGLTFGTFVAGGRNRKTRLAVMDATAVDSHRRLVLVRRDDIEHLLLIGGPTDVVVERDIKLGQMRRPALTGDGGHEPAAPQPKPRQPEPAAAARPAPAQPQIRPAPTRPQPVAQPPRQPAVREAPPQPALRPAPPARPAPAPVAVAAAPPSNGISTTIRQPPAPRPVTARQTSLDDALLHELEVTFEAGPAGKPAPPPELSLDEEMTKLLGELSSQKR